MIDHKPHVDTQLPAGWRWARLGEVCDISPSRPRGFKRSFDALTTFVPMAAVDGDLGQIVASGQRVYADVERGYTYFEEGDVLFAKITPCMQNKKSAIARGLIDGLGFGTTEFHILRPRDEVLAEWIYYQVREPTFLSLAAANFTGAVGQQRVPASFLEQYLIPLPPLPIQRAIVRQIDRDMAEVARLRAAAERQRAAAAALPAAYLREVFEGVEARGWEHMRLGDVLLDIQAGKSLKCEERPATLEEWGVLKVSAVSWGTFKQNENKVLPPTFTPPNTYEVQPGDLLISRANTTELVGAIVLVKTTRPRLVLSDKTLRLVPREDLVAKPFLQMALGTYVARTYIEENATGTSDSMKNISQETIRRIPLVLPPYDVQFAIVHQFQQRMAESTHLRDAAARQRAAIEALPATLLREVFGGVEGRPAGRGASE